MMGWILFLFSLESFADTVAPGSGHALRLDRKHGFSRVQGLPEGCNTSYSFETDHYVAVEENQMDANRFYVRFDSNLRKFVWVSKDSFLPMLEGSKVQGWRLGFANRKEWYVLQADGNWVTTTDGNLPRVYRRNEQGMKVVSEEADNTWQSWGGSQVAPSAPVPDSGPMIPAVPTPQTLPRPLPPAQQFAPLPLQQIQPFPGNPGFAPQMGRRLGGC